MKYLLIILLLILACGTDVATGPRGVTGGVTVGPGGAWNKLTHIGAGKVSFKSGTPVHVVYFTDGLDGRKRVTSSFGFEFYPNDSLQFGFSDFDSVWIYYESKN